VEENIPVPDPKVAKWRIFVHLLMDVVDQLRVQVVAD
jgi:hypothetical protein